MCFFGKVKEFKFFFFIQELKIQQSLDQEEKYKILIHERVELEKRLIDMKNSYEAKLIEIERTMQLKDIRLSVKSLNKKNNI